ncbi:MAG: flagellar basal body L-ring protein FlgH [Thiovulaceae bacterium]|nr:flagellar basal body L-ring protein FlgH [Sulfurimonadaceae bacterium]MCW9025849.1 flagellar basal body L-ring protein FlgH [Sulfurimonadaceae bacterium]
MLRKYLTFFMLIYAILLLSGCTAELTKPEIDFKPPKYVEQMPPKEDKQDFASTGSIFGQGDNPLFSDHKAMHVNDIVTVEISENAAASSSGSKDLSKDDSTNLGGGVFASTGGSSHVDKYIGKVNGVTDVGFSATTANAFSAAGSASKDASFSTTISARIVKVMINGNYFISGKREILVDDQKQIIQISGVIRPYDIDQYNKISSTQMSDAKILYKTQGDIDRATEQGWGSKALQAIWPF